MAYKAAGVGGKGPMMIGVLWFEILLSFAVISLRLWTRKYVKGKIGWDDICLVATFVLMVVFAAITTVACFHGMGRHFNQLKTDQFARAMMLVMVGQSTVSMAIGMAKVVVATFLLRIVTAAWQRIFLWFCIGTMMFISVFLSISLFAQCTPVESIWNPLLADEKVCSLDLTTVAFVDCAYAAVMDFTLAIFPWIALHNLNIKRKEKIAICVSLSLGIFAGICGVIRTSGLKVLSNTGDYLFVIADSIIWTSSEVTTTIVCVCIPSLRPLYGKITGQLSSSGGEQTTPSYDAGNSYKLSSYTGKNGTKTNIEAAQARATTLNDSDESILLRRNGDIVMTQEVSVTYTDPNDGKGSVN
ncbi:hypothetical protein GMORB2_3225 [Geosmithia morbida]|uniref:Rhodopsin domain-containing protein n=1 Tax=Geosmithia morbida TaxID=1094350 RepID=A0A9P5D3E3_9HYPO|nr:uncharacterized protein GMORB2_3225 [Geosmithia morbida]KAF4120424.1 hypothetical protein GMORB2_3225 [Geosmithia morbida]